MDCLGNTGNINSFLSGVKNHWLEKPAFPLLIKHWPNSTLERKKEENVCMAYSLMYWEIIRAGIQAVSQRPKLKQRMLVTGLLFMANSVWILIQLMTIWTGMARSKVILSPTTIINKEKPQKHAHRSIQCRQFLNWAFCFPGICCIKLLKKTSQQS